MFKLNLSPLNVSLVLDACRKSRQGFVNKKATFPAEEEAIALNIKALEKIIHALEKSEHLSRVEDGLTEF